jgi:hypothetical protein
MSNPLLRPNDPRFQKPEIRDAAGQNRFGDEQPAGKLSGDEGVFAAAAADDERPYQPRYEAQQADRASVLLSLAGLGWGCGLIGSISLLGFFSLGWMLPLLGLVPSAAAWFLAHEDLKTIDTGAIDAAARPRTRNAYWLGLLGLLLCAAVVGSMLWRQMTFLPDLF